MSTEFAIYLTDIADAVKDTAEIVFIMSAVAMAIIGVIYAASLAAEETKAIAKSRQLFTWSVVIAVVSCLVNLFTPTSKSVAAMYLIPRVGKSETWQNMSGCLSTMSEEWLKNTIKKIEEPPETE